ncbi:DUF551 domain-containing protein [Yersinia enterocolitica]|uniref:DUF551 domain-containing protein n=1 Tax=Yersinia enterocolitica TaxID=630 RepID=UPI0028B4E932|nr:DUF551 domain-containing protein [Yersinia enterocolitica]EKN3769545.1 DUF551 domain-containing protein [Yersinia enterocolitica]EKN3828375.1 DUF551 domain-containing protein [Yersinia enterocolitica]EKN4826800.1 DUF551 domain-containing protein [Yersinia enterocolitica]ELI7902404.1 DUF551 domain-containing protein [Yersinia enterocolitica]
MKELDGFTVERLEEILNFDLPRHPAALEEIVALARIALAAKRAEPVYQYHTGIINEEGDIDWYWVDCDKGFYSQYDNQHRRIVYTTSQLNSQQGWIKCSDQMPEDDTLCLGVDECGVIWTMHFDDGEFRADTGDVDDLEISHWMPLPAAPEKPL